MPSYDYHCPACDKQHLVVRSISDDKDQYCPDCGFKMARKYTAVPAVFKGEGFYTTDKFSDR